MRNAKESTPLSRISTDDNPLEKPSPSYRRTILSSFVGLAGLIALLVLSLVNEYQEADKHARLEVENFSRVLEEHALATVQKVDLLLRDMQRHVHPADMRLARDAGGQRPGELHALLKSHRESVPEVSLLHLINAKGEHIHSALDVLPSVILADRPYFQRQRNDPAAGLVISSPIVSRVTGNWTLILSRRINFEDGSFAGTVQASLVMDYFQQFYRSIDLGKQGLVSLYDKELHLAARYPPSEKDMGKTTHIYAKTYIEKGVKHATYHAKSALDGVERIYSFRQVGELPLFVFAGIAEDDYLGEWQRHTWQYGIGLAILSLVVITLGLRQWRGEEALRKSDESLRTIADYTYDWEYWEGPQRQLLYISPSCEYVTGYSPAEFMADPELLYRIIHPEDRHLMKEHHHDPTIQDEASIDFRIVRRDSDVRWIAHGCLAVYGAEGQSLGRRASNRDITERKRLEAELQQLNNSLEQRVNEEVAQRMAHEKLLIQQSRLAAMGEMIGNIAHQWRQPINELALLLGNIKDAYEYHELDKAYLDKEVMTGQELIQKMSATIDDFRNFFKPNKEKQRFMACDAVVEAIKLVSHSFKNNNIEIIHDESPESCAVIGYPNEFAQVALNALTNAKDAVADKKIDGKVSIRVEKGKDTAIISIRDNGGGIPEKVLPKVFDPYFTTKEKGTGIGLYMSKMIMDHMDGDITIRNIEDGTEVLLTLPLAEPSTA